MLPVPPHLLSRLLYTNPVCVLITRNIDASTTPTMYHAGTTETLSSSSSSFSYSTLPRSTEDDGLFPPSDNGTSNEGYNAMVISWLTPVDNRGHFTMSLNNNRHTLQNLFHGYQRIRRNTGGNESSTSTAASAASALFTLSPATDGMQDTLLRIGSISGKDPDCQASNGKLHHLRIPLCPPGNPSSLSSLIPNQTESDNVTTTTRSRRNSGTDTLPRTKKQRKDWMQRSHGGTDYLASLRCVLGSPAHIVCELVQILYPSTAPSSTENENIIPLALSSSSSLSKGASATVDQPDIGHTIWLCRIIHGYVHPSYWITEKTFGPGAASLSAAEGSTSSVWNTNDYDNMPEKNTLRDTKKDKNPVPPLLSFMGSKQFALMIPQRMETKEE